MASAKKKKKNVLSVLKARSQRSRCYQSCFLLKNNGIETCVISCMKQVASPGSMHNTGCLGLVHWDDPEGWCGEGGGRRV